MLRITINKETHDLHVGLIKTQKDDGPAHIADFEQYSGELQTKGKRKCDECPRCHRVQVIIMSI